MHEFKIPEKINENEFVRDKNPRKIDIYFSKIACYLKSTNSSVHEHVQCRQTTKFCAHEIK